jgi:hypothetical protein
MENKAILFVLLSPAAHSMHAMPVAPAPTETPLEKGTRFKKECAQAAIAELAMKQRYINTLLHGNEYLENDEAEKLAQQEIKVQVKLRIKVITKAIFPQAPKLGRPVELNDFLEREADRYIKEAQEAQAQQASKKCAFFRCCC